MEKELDLNKPEDAALWLKEQLGKIGLPPGATPLYGWQIVHACDVLLNKFSDQEDLPEPHIKNPKEPEGEA